MQYADKAAQRRGKEETVDVVTGLDQTQIEKITQFFGVDCENSEGYKENYGTTN